QDGVRSTLLSVFKNGSASTLSVAAGVKAAMANILKTVTSDIQVKQFADQSVFVKAAVSGVVREGLIAAALTALMILLFLGSWRSTFIIALSIPLSVLSSIAILGALGETINLMTLGGLALAVGILVDDATVALENIHRHMAGGKQLEQAILAGAQEIALHAFVSATPTARCSLSVLSISCPARPASSRSAPVPGFWWASWASTFSRPLTPASSVCTCALPPEGASRKPRGSWTRLRPPSVRSCPRRNSAEYSTTSAYPTPASASVIAAAAFLAPATRIFSFRSSAATRPR